MLRKTFYTCSIPWKTNPPELRNYLSMVCARLERTNSAELLITKGTSKAAIDAIFQAQVEKGYVEEFTDLL